MGIGTLAAVGTLAVLVEGELIWIVALLFASCLVSKGMGVDGVRDRLTVYGIRSDVVVKKKVEGLRVARASLSRRIRQDECIFVAKVRVRIQNGKVKVSRHTFVAKVRVRMQRRVAGQNYIREPCHL